MMLGTTNIKFSDYLLIQRWAVGSCSGNRVNATGVWDATLYIPMSHDVSEEPATFFMIVHYSAASTTAMMQLAGLCVYGPHLPERPRTSATQHCNSERSKLHRYSRNIRYGEAQCVFCEVGTEFVILLK